ncbi:calmodulin-binding transcription activator 1-like isoform X3 [Ananas comosus]|uniref:Calmodulin-binding transcription activator 1-like isoform X3 n=1 Tax=Ananas comosus TaxID=4615 RepID=A0A6P5GJZ4_ANACO|nr:calmodulin-binding transcription activator 1-like isoform X3 [Ananas comosus]
MAEEKGLLIAEEEEDIPQILQEAKTRWLRPSEICEILRNYKRFKLNADPPYKPAGGSLFLFDRKALRYFRKDGHNWRKKKDGKTVREAHEKLKCGSVDVLHCYYAHGEENENFQRRSYWLLDEQLDHIVLVHYRDVNEGSRPTFSHLSNTEQNRVNHMEETQASTFTHLSPSTFTSQTSYVSSPSAADWSGQAPSSELEDADSGEELGGASASHTDSVSCPGFQFASLPGDTAVKDGIVINQFYSRDFPDTAVSSRLLDPLFSSQVSLQNTTIGVKQQISGAPQGSFCENDHNSAASKWVNMTKKDVDMKEQNISFEPTGHSGDISRRVIDDHTVLNSTLDDTFNMLRNAQLEILIGNGDRENQGADDQSLEYPTKVSYPLKNNRDTNMHNNEHGDLKKLDSFGRWMSKEIGKDCDDSLMASDSGSYWNTLDTQSDDKEVSTSLPPHMQLDIDTLGPSLSQEQLFSILDFSPDWAYSNVETKVLISGRFLGNVDPGSVKWCCMFGEHEVPAEILTAGVLRCKTPAHPPGRVPFYVTCSDRLARSEVREFEFCENPSATHLLPKSEAEELHLQIRFAKLLSVGTDKKLLCSVENCLKCKVKQRLSSLLKDDEKQWAEVEMCTKAERRYYYNVRNKLIENLLKGKLYEWLVCKAHKEDGRGPNILDEEGQGAIHLAAALGYDWAMDPIVACGINPSFRDLHGRTGLHWGAYYGREEVVAALVRLGVDPGAVEDPTSTSPQGLTAADLASARGHKGIAGFLAEAHLTSHLSSLALKKKVGNSVSATLAAEKTTVEAAEDQNIVFLNDNNIEEQLSLRGSLDALRKSTEAAARIHTAFRVQSFIQRQSTEKKDEDSWILDEAVLSTLNNRFQKLGHFNEALHAAAAVKIQQKYRGWKGRREFLKIRNKIVKIQAHVRGHQVRKQYRKIVWSVSIVEKLILRWRRKGAGLRGFQADRAISSTSKQEDGKSDEYEFLRVGRKQKEAGVEKALARVQSMARNPEARDQYMRLVASSHKSKLGDGESSSSQIQSSEEEKMVDKDQPASMIH